MTSSASLVGFFVFLCTLSLSSAVASMPQHNRSAIATLRKLSLKALKRHQEGKHAHVAVHRHLAMHNQSTMLSVAHNHSARVNHSVEHNHTVKLNHTVQHKHLVRLNHSVEHNHTAKLGHSVVHKLLAKRNHVNSHAHHATNHVVKHNLSSEHNRSELEKKKHQHGQARHGHSNNHNHAAKNHHPAQHGRSAKASRGHGGRGKLRPRQQWREPLLPAEETEFEKDLDVPIAHWLEQHPRLTSDFFAKFGAYRGYRELAPWKSARLVTNYYVSAHLGANSWRSSADFQGEGKGLHVIFNVNGANVSTHLDHPSYIADDPYCFSLGWLKGQGLDGSLRINKTAWDAVAKLECDKIEATEKAANERSTVRRHIAFTRAWPQHCQCSVVSPAGGLPAPYSLGLEVNGTACTSTPTKQEFFEHVRRKCLLGFAAAEMAYCYERGCLKEGNEIAHGKACA